MMMSLSIYVVNAVLSLVGSLEPNLTKLKIVSSFKYCMDKSLKILRLKNLMSFDSELNLDKSTGRMYLMIGIEYE